MEFNSNSNINHYLVVGSGPAAVSCASSLISRGLKVLMIDPGIELEDYSKECVERLFAQNVEDWDSKDILQIKGTMKPGMKGVPIKHVFGSDFPYRHAKGFIPIRKNETDLLPSFAAAGFSNVWGGAVLPYKQIDIADWPITISELAPHYSAVAKIVNIEGQLDDLEKDYPLYSKTFSSLRRSSQSERIFQNFKDNKKKLFTSGFNFGQSRLALNNSYFAAKEGCVYCGLCLYGCPKKILYSSDSTISNLAESPNFEYLKGYVARSFKDHEKFVEVEVYDVNNNINRMIKSKKLFLAAGVIQTSAIVAKSLSMFNRPIEILDSQYYLLPMLLKGIIKGVQKEKLFTLSQLFLEINNETLCKRTVHLQLYTYNSMFRDLFHRMAGPLHPVVKPAIDVFLGKMVLAQGYLHSDYSSRLQLTVLDSRPEGFIELKPKINPSTLPIVKKVVRFLFAHRSFTSLYPLSFALSNSLVGRGFHSGGSFPMKVSPDAMSTDLLGRPAGTNNVHCVDATVLPSIPATTITFTVMANAHRIGSYA